MYYAVKIIDTLISNRADIIIDTFVITWVLNCFWNWYWNCFVFNSDSISNALCGSDTRVLISIERWIMIPNDYESPVLARVALFIRSPQGWWFQNGQIWSEIWCWCQHHQCSTFRFPRFGAGTSCDSLFFFPRCGAGTSFDSLFFFQESGRKTGNPNADVHEAHRNPMFALKTEPAGALNATGKS